MASWQVAALSAGPTPTSAVSWAVAQVSATGTAPVVGNPSWRVLTLNATVTASTTTPPSTAPPLYMFHNGAWIACKLYARVSGAWVLLAGSSSAAVSTYPAVYGSTYASGSSSADLYPAVYGATY